MTGSPGRRCSAFGYRGWHRRNRTADPDSGRGWHRRIPRRRSLFTSASLVDRPGPSCRPGRGPRSAAGQECRERGRALRNRSASSRERYLAGSTTEWPRSPWQTASIRPGRRSVRARLSCGPGGVAHREQRRRHRPVPQRSGRNSRACTGRVPRPPSPPGSPCPSQLLTITYTIGNCHSPARLSDS